MLYLSGVKGGVSSSLNITSTSQHHINITEVTPANKMHKRRRGGLFGRVAKLARNSE